MIAVSSSSCLIRVNLLRKRNMFSVGTLLSLSLLLLLVLVVPAVQADWRPTHAGLDTNSSCVFWADLGECETNPNYMYSACPASCKKYTNVLRVKQNLARMVDDPHLVHRLIVATDAYGTLPDSYVVVIDRAIEYMMTTWYPYVEKSVILVPAWLYDYSPTQSLLKDTLLLSILFSFIFLFLPYGRARHVFCSISGLFIVQYMKREVWIHSFGTSMLVYLLFFILPKDRKLYITVIPSVLFLYLFAMQLYTMYDNYRSFIPSVVAFQMLITQRCWIITYNLYDGYALHHNDEKDIGIGTKKCAKFAIKEIPNFFEYLGYCFNFSCMLSGPSFEFSIYKQTCDGTVFYKKIETTIVKCDDDEDTDTNAPAVWVPTLLVRVLPNNIEHVAKPMAEAYVAYLLCQQLALNGYTTQMVVSANVLSMPFLFRMKFLFISTLHCRCMFYLAWKSSEFINNICYFGFEGYDDETNEVIGWEHSTSVRIALFEFSRDMRMATKNWNVKTAMWLKRYVYYRHNFSVVVTFAVSAVWHGFYPAYILLGINMILYTWYFRMLMAKVITPYITPRLQHIKESHWMTKGNEQQQKNKKRVFDVLVSIVPVAHGQLVGTATAPIFFLRCMDSTLLFWKSYYFYPILVPAIGSLILTQLPTPPKKVKTE